MNKWKTYTSNEIKPSGWLLRQLKIQANGLSGNLDKIWRDVKDSAWIGGNAEGWERVPYWLDGFIPLAYLLGDEDMITRAKRYIDCIISSQKEDGWLCPCEDQARSEYDTWALILVLKTLTVYYECSNDERIPTVIYRALKNYYTLLKEERIKLFNWGKFRWFEAFISINFIYERHKEDWIVSLAKILRAQGADYPEFTDEWKHPLDFWQWHTHIVNITMMLKYEAVSCSLLGEEYTDEAERLYGILKKYNGTPAEIFTGDECLAGTSPIRGAELCSVAELMYSYEQLFAYTGEQKWAERLEVVAFNAFPATLSDDMWAHQYDQMSNQIACQTFPGRSLFGTNGSESHLFGLEPNFGCCTANFNQGWPKLALSTYMHSGSTVINLLPIPSRLSSEEANVRLDTDYPFENVFNYSVEAKKDCKFIIRIPSFAEHLTLDGEPLPTKNIEINLLAGESKKFCVSYGATPHFESRPRGLSCVRCGSLIFSVPIKYEKKMLEYERDGVERKFPYCDYEYIPKSPWNYAYSDDRLTYEKREVGNLPFSSEEPPAIVKATVKRIDWGLQPGYATVCAESPNSTEPISGAEEIELYPYGCAKLRMTELPKI